MEKNTFKTWIFCAFYSTFVTLSMAQVQQQQVVFSSQSVHGIDGVAWASNIGNNLVTGSNFWVYINPQLEAIVAKKSSNGTITTKLLMQNVQNNDNHAEFSLGVDNDGYIHVIGGQHNSSPQYYVSTNPDDISSFEFRGNDLSLGGLQGTQMTYQSFVRSNKGTLFVSYRNNVVEDFVTGARSIALARYDTKTKKWTMIGGKNYQVTNQSCQTITGAQGGITAFVWNNSGVGDMRPPTGKCFSQAHYQGYQLRIKFDQNNGMHASYNMADSINMAAGQDVSKFLTHLFYAYSPDEGNTWFKANGNQITTFPITKATGDLVHKSIPPGYVYPATTSTPTMPNASGTILDKDGLPIIVQFDNIANSTLMFKWSGTKWVNQTSYTNRSDRFYTDLSKKIIYNFGSSKQFQMSTDNMATFINNVTQVYPATWYVIVDDYYLTKTRNVMYYARDETLGNGTIVNMVVSSPDALAPAAPSGLTSSDIAQNRITLNWTPSPELDVCRYDVSRNGILVGSTGSSYYTVSGLSPSTSYTFTVKAVDGSGNVSPASSGLLMTTTGIDSENPVTPSGLAATQVNGSSFKINWNAATDNVGVVGYEIYKDGVWLASTTYTSYHVKGLSGSTTYGISVRAKDAAGNLSSAAILNVKTYGSGLIIYEPYNYTVGTTSNDPDAGTNGGAGLPATNAGGNPTGTGTGLRGNYTGEASVVSGLTYMNLATSGGAHNITNATWGATVNPYRYMTTDPFLSKRVAADGNFGADGQSLYFSFIAKTSSSTAGAFSFVLGGSRNVYIENTATGWSINDNKAIVAPTTGTLQLNTATLLVVKVDFKAGVADVVSLYKNPPIDGTLGSPVASLTVGADFTIGNFNTRPNVANAMTIDEFRMGLSYADVTPSAVVAIAPDTQAPTAPTLSSTGKTSTSVSLSWTVSTDNVGVTGYDVFNGTTKINSSAVTGTTFTVSNLTASTAYNFTVKAMDAAGNNSVSSNTIAVTTNAAADTQAPTASTLSSTGKTSTSVSLSWTAATDNVAVTGYDVYNGTTKVNTSVITGTTFTVNNLSANTAYNFTVKAIDAAGNTSVASNTLSVTTSVAQVTCSATGNILREVWLNMPGTSISTIPTSAPSSSTQISIFESPIDVAENFVCRIRGFVCPPLSGSYTFWIASDDNSELWLSTNDSPANKVKIASVSDWTGSRDWFKFPSQKSVSINLTAGQKYYIEALHKENTGGDNLAVGWDLPDGTQERPIPGTRLSPSTHDMQAPTAPTVSSTAKTHNSVSLSWTGATDNVGVTGYDVFNGTTKVNTTAVNGTTFTVSNLTASTVYNFTIKAMDAAGNTSVASNSLAVTTNSAPDTQPPTAPTLSSTGKTHNSVSLSWTGATDNIGVTGYDVYNGSILLGSTTSLTFTATGLSASTAYAFTAKAKDAAGNGSVASNTVDVTTNAAPDTQMPTAPTLSSTGKTTSSVNLSWTASTDNVGVTGYDVYNGAGKVNISNITGTTYSVTGLAENTTYTFIVKAKDAAGNLSAASNSLTVTTNTATNPCSATGTILREYWANISGTSVSAIPVTSAPTSSSQLTMFEGPSDIADNYGSRIRGYICPPTTGLYTFWISSDDNSELWLSTTDMPANKVMIASVTGWTNIREWVKYGSQKSVPINLTQGQNYYIEALHKEGTSGDNLAVGWDLPDGTQERPILGSRLTPYNNVITGNETSEKYSVEVYPNPTNGMLNLRLEGKFSGDALLSLNSMMGVELKSFKISNISSNVEIAIDIAEIPAGTYYIKGDMGGAKILKKIVKF